VGFEDQFTSKKKNPKTRFVIVKLLYPLQQKKCWLCKENLDANFVIDHDHNTGYVKGLVHECCDFNIDIQINEQTSSPFPIRNNSFDNYFDALNGSGIDLFYDTSVFVS